MNNEKTPRAVVVNESGPSQKKTEQEIRQENEQLEQELNEKPAMDPEVLQMLKDKQKSKEDKVKAVTTKRDRSLYFGFVGSGQAGSRLCEVAYGMGYEGCCFNTAQQDLEFINMPENRKTLIRIGLDGAGKELENGRRAVEQNADLIINKLKETFSEEQEMLMLCISGGGGTGSGSATRLVELMGQLGKPIGVIYVLPMDTEDALSKHNAVVTLGKLAKMASDDIISPLVVVDNSKIELLYPGLSKAEFWSTANNAIVEPLHLFNMLSAQPSAYESLDSSDFGKVLLAGDCTIFGSIEIENYLETTAIAEAILENLETGLLANDFNLKEARVGGFIVVGNKKVLQETPAVNIQYASHMISDICDSPALVSGVYEQPIEEDVVRVYTMLSGLGLPSARIESLKEEAEQKMEALRNKEKTRANNMAVNYGNKTTTQNMAEEIHQKIKMNKSAFGRLTNNAINKNVKDRRKR